MLVLASNSPRRRDLLNQAGYPFRVIVSEADELKADDIPPAELVMENARRKAADVKGKVRANEVILGADTLVIMDGKVFGKPKDEKEAIAMLTELSGKSHFVYTGIALIKGEKLFQRAEATKVTFASLSDEDIARYAKSGEPLGKAGAYAVQGRAATFIKGIEGSFSNVVGLPLYALTDLAKEAGIDLYDDDGA